MEANAPNPTLNRGNAMSSGWVQAPRMLLSRPTAISRALPVAVAEDRLVGPGRPGPELRLGAERLGIGLFVLTCQLGQVAVHQQGGQLGSGGLQFRRMLDRR